MRTTSARGWLVAAAGGSALGDGMLVAAVPLLAATLTRDPRTISVVVAMSTLPWLLLGVVGGALTDRWDRRRVMVVADGTRVVLLAVMGLLVVTGVVHVAVLAVLAFALGCAQVLFDSAIDGYVASLLGRDRSALLRLSSHQRVVRGVADATGPVLGGLLFAGHRALPFLGDALTFLFSALVVRALPPVQQARPPSSGPASIRREVREGLSYLRRHSLLLAMCARPAIGNMGFMAVSAVLVLVVEERYGLPVSAFGWIFSVQAVGGVLGAVLAPPVARRIGTGTLLTLTAAGEGLGFAGVAASTSPITLYVGMAMVGVAMGATMTVSPAIRQAVVPAELMGRVGAASRTLALGVAPVGAGVGGVLGATAGLTAPIWFAALLLVLTAGIAARWTNDRAIEEAFAATDPSPDVALEGGP